MASHTITLQTILQQGYDAYAHDQALPGYVRRAVQAILACRTARLGGHVQACPEGHIERIWYNSCRHRMCPLCAWLQIERWLITQKARLLACEHYHVIFTLPSELHALWLANVAVMTTLLFASVRDTLLELLGDAQYLGATPGIIATLHTWSQTLRLHPHIHTLVTGGGLTRTGQWVAVQQWVFAPVTVVMALFRGKLLAAIRQGVAHGQLQLPAGQRPPAAGKSVEQAGPEEVERAYSGAVSVRDGGADLSGAVSAGWPALQPAAGVMCRGEGDLPLSGERGGRRPPAERSADGMPLRSSCGAICSTCRLPGLGWCGRMGCTRRPSVRRWRCAGRNWDKVRWSSPVGAGLADGVPGARC